MHLLSKALLQLFLAVLLRDWLSTKTTADAQRTPAPSPAAVGNRWQLPVNGALFLPRDFVRPAEVKYELQLSDHVTRTGRYHLATIDSVMPVMDVAIRDAQKRYLPQWTDLRPWLRLRPTPIGSCEDQKRAAWAVQEAIQWTNGSRVRSVFSLSLSVSRSLSLSLPLSLSSPLAIDVSSVTK